MKCRHLGLRAATVANLSWLSCSLLLSITAGNAFDHSGMYEVRPRVGSAYLLPKILSIHPFNMHEQPPISSMSAGSIHIDAKGNARLYISNLKMPNLKGSAMKALDKELAAAILGKANGPQGEDDNEPYFWTFHVMAIQAFELDIYHIDVQFTDADQHWKKYRVRGYQIANPRWQLVE
jgi:hypothetical protein